jgi:hypothetical protein
MSKAKSEALSCGHAAPHHAKGLCLSCYHKFWRRAHGASPGPERWTEAEIADLKELAVAKKMITMLLTLDDIVKEMSRKHRAHYTAKMISMKIHGLGLLRRGKNG